MPFRFACLLWVGSMHPYRYQMFLPPFLLQPETHADEWMDRRRAFWL